jgi:hypothetical protein
VTTEEGRAAILAHVAAHGSITGQEARVVAGGDGTRRTSMLGDLRKLVRVGLLVREWDADARRSVWRAA